MGACYSKGGAVPAEEEEEEDNRWWKNSRGGKISGRRTDGKIRKSSTFIGKFGGGGGGAAAELQQVAGRLFGNGASSISSLYTQQGKKGTNQDAMIVWENFSSRSDTVFCGVFDGHGPYGHMVARKVRDTLPLLLCTEWKANLSANQNGVGENGNASESAQCEELLDDDWSERLEADENEKLPEMHLPLKRSILKAFKLMDKELKLPPDIDCFCSGTTAVTIVKQAHHISLHQVTGRANILVVYGSYGQLDLGQDLIIANVGDSRAVLAARDVDNSLSAVQLTIDLKPNLPREAARIQQCKGRVFALQDEPEVSRVWLPNSDSPGLAMARAFGDFCLKDFGLISVPDVCYHLITDKDEFIVLASDGVWDVLSNKEAVDIVASAPSRPTAARALVDCATRAWRLKYPTSKMDDCAAVCLFLEHLSTIDGDPPEYKLGKVPEDKVKEISVSDGEGVTLDSGSVLASHASVLEHSGTQRSSGEIVPVTESTEQKLPERSLGQSKRSLAECISTAEDDEWSALEGVTRVNSLLSLPRLLSVDKMSASWRKWL
ncbi:hypothetical protein RJ640_004982 [Escallonia rubra]|uniref:PPM-type phosphatase domain-containing protein n=1 Tax=Escallonia rubra TaxID=112253 RepID=A0AA88QLQ4_9ASTE|nr:hypothetical protein RJ640_004982 [Escallonia rubra]